MKRTILTLLGAFVLLVGIPLCVRGDRPGAAARRAMEIGAALEAEIRAYEARDRCRPPLFGPTVEGTAWEHYHRAFALRREIDDGLARSDRWRDRHVLNDWTGAPHALPADSEAYLDSLEPVFRLVRRGASTGESGLASDVRVGILSQAFDTGAPRERIPHDLMHHEFVARATLAISRGRPGDGVDWLLAGDRMADDLVRGGAHLEVLTGLRGRIAAAESLAALVEAGRLPQVQVDRIEQWARANPGPPPPGWEAMDGTWLLARIELLRSAGRHNLAVDLLAGEWVEEVLHGPVNPGRDEALEIAEELGALQRDLVRAHPAGDEQALRQAEAALRSTFAGRSRAPRFFGLTIADAIDRSLTAGEQLRQARARLLDRARHPVEGGARKPR